MQREQTVEENPFPELIQIKQGTLKIQNNVLATSRGKKRQTSILRLTSESIEWIKHLFINTSYIQTLDLSNCHLNEQLTNQIHEAIIQNTTIRTLDISRNSHKMEVRDISRLAAATLSMNTITSFNFSLNNLRDGGANFISRALETNTSARYLSLSLNGISETGIRYICQALEHNTTLRSLDISGNFFGKDAARWVGALLLVNTSLLSLNCMLNAISEGVQYITEALKSNTTLLNLNLSQNSMAHCAQYIAEMLRVNQSLFSINLSRNFIGLAGLSEIKESLENNVALLSITLDPSSLTKEIEGSIARNKRGKLYWGLKMNYLARVMFWGGRGSEILPAEMMYYIFLSLPPKGVLSEEEKTRVLQYACNDGSLEKGRREFLKEVFWVEIRYL